jgi:hypothetical protein
MKYSLYSQDQEIAIAFFEKFNKEDIKEQVTSHLTEFPTDTLELCKEFNTSDVRKYYGNEIISFYGVNPKTKKVSRIITRNNKDYFKSF